MLDAALHSYAIHLRDANANLTEQIRRENIKTREIIFTYLAIESDWRLISGSQI